MNEQERSMIEGLFQRLQQAETQSGPRDQEAEALIQNLMARQPSAPYLLAQVVLVQEQGLRNLQTRVEELERQQAERAQDGGGFLGGLFGGGQPQPPSQPATPKAGGWSNSRLPTHIAGVGLLSLQLSLKYGAVRHGGGLIKGKLRLCTA